MSGEGCVGCPPCTGRGNEGHGMSHCAECCFGSGVEAEYGCPVHNPTTPPADTASTGADVEALARVLHDWVGGCCVERFDACVFDGTGAREEAARLLAYPAMRDMLAAHDAATAERVRRETEEGIAAACKHPAGQVAKAAGLTCCVRCSQAAAIARGQGR